MFVNHTLKHLTPIRDQSHKLLRLALSGSHLNNRHLFPQRIERMPAEIAPLVPAHALL
jgi:hypothetical protein